MEITNFWVDIKNADDQRLGAGPLRATDYRITSRVSACGQFTFTVSAFDPNIDALQEKRFAFCYYDSGDLLGAGIIDKIAFSIRDGAPILTVSGNDIGYQLTYTSVRDLQLGDEEGGVTDGPEQIVAYAPDWNMIGGETAKALYVGFDGQSVLSALTTLSDYSGEHFLILPSRDINWFQSYSATTLRAANQTADPIAIERNENLCLIQSLEDDIDTFDLVTAIIPRGSGNGDAVIDLASGPPVTETGGYEVLSDGSVVNGNTGGSLALYGRIERVIDFKQIGPLSNTSEDIQNARQMLYDAAVEWLMQHEQPRKTYRVKFAHTPTWISAGTALPVDYRLISDGRQIRLVQGIFNVLEATNQISEGGLYTCEVVISEGSKLPQNDADLLVEQIQSARVVSTHPQLSASVDSFGWRDEMDDGHGASCRFWLGQEYTTIQRAVLRFRVQPLRSTVKSVGGDSTSTSSGGGGTSTSASGGGQTAEGGGHLHNCPVTGGISPDSELGFVVDGPYIGLISSRSGDDGKIFQVGVNTNHEHSISAHTHSVTIPDHTHDVTAAVTMEYGIFEETSANTLELEDLVIRLNGGSDLSDDVVSIGSGWYALDLTGNGLTDDYSRPVQESNEITFTTAVEKTARIEAQLTVRGVVQAVAFSA